MWHDDIGRVETHPLLEINARLQAGSHSLHNYLYRGCKETCLSVARQSIRIKVHHSRLAEEAKSPDVPSTNGRHPIWMLSQGTFVSLGHIDTERRESCNRSELDNTLRLPDLISHLIVFLARIDEE
ncbi:MAG: hypothetical protein RBG13Loki_1629 [Promethearchaeota archaeon CR_4]|nr:MAG: hypothetical protein RBG13Loki_1629 [Candidatus Lokiarchaeota archaeon CR_4]